VCSTSHCRTPSGSCANRPVAWLVARRECPVHSEVLGRRGGLTLARCFIPPTSSLRRRRRDPGRYPGRTKPGGWYLTPSIDSPPAAAATSLPYAAPSCALSTMGVQRCFLTGDPVGEGEANSERWLTAPLIKQAAPNYGDVRRRLQRSTGARYALPRRLPQLPHPHGRSGSLSRLETSDTITGGRRTVVKSGVENLTLS